MLMTRYGKVRKSHAFQACTARTSYCKDRYSPNTSKLLWFPLIPLSYPQISPMEMSWWLSMTSHLSLSGRVRCRLLTSCIPWRCLLPCPWRGVWGLIQGVCLGVSEWYSWKPEILGCALGISEFSVWSRDTILAQPWKVWLLCWLFTEISQYKNVMKVDKDHCVIWLFCVH